jgi:hypothetical protein
MSKTICELPKNSREEFRFSLAEFKGHKFIDMRVYAKEDGKDPLLFGRNLKRPWPKWKRP